MEELTIEQKAKHYNEALERAKAFELPEYKNIAESIFPELKESEDERTRKGILELVRQSSEVLDKQNQNNMISWLEKQGEPQQEWSEEDENYLQSAENACEYQYGKNTSTILWLKSLKDRMEGKEEQQ